ncbi:unnamed protein product [Allacma fusca]|uniref:Alpha-N-arabinofuranosidase n=1 Tax=Allacma fusca TaxID=39272 RepID=A0A8J2PFT7_9HEXA|nr:unnamed protein product [Allacma fusca]
MTTSFIIFFAVTCLVGFSAQQRTFSNPILDGNSADPAVLKVGNYYYLTLSEERETELTVFKSPTLTNFRNAEKSVAYRTKNGQSNLWASEMHEINGDLYIYFCMDGNGKDHRMYAIKADDPTNPMGTWSDAIRLMPDWDHGAIDGTVMKHDWEAGVNEGAYFIYRNNVSFMIFSASTTWEPNYCLGLMSIEADKDPMNPSFWNYGEDKPVFYRNDEEDVYTTGHASFTVSNDGTETWMVYHGTVNTTHIDGFRIARVEQIDWDENGRPVFPRPHGYNNPQPVPSGDPENQRTFTNPILDGNSADPAVLKVGNYYYLTLSEERETELTVFKSLTLTNFRNAEKSVAYRTKNEQSNLWASEMHEINGNLYIYFCMDGNGKDHRMYAIKADDSTNPMGTWSDAIRLMPDWDHGAIDGTVMKHGNGQNYFVWASNAFNRRHGLWIAELIDPVTVGESKLYLREPRSDWEIQGGAINEGAYFIYKNNVSFMIFSASSTAVPDYCLGLMSIEGDKDPMNPSFWNYGEDKPVFYRNDEDDVYTTGHASFTVSNDGTETWMVYHGTANTTHIDGFRIARIEKIDWDENGRPVFPRPHGHNHPQPVPSGDLVNE